MYRSCIFCSAELGTNEAIEPFPVGRSVAFDAWKGRLWAVCPKCARWNLAPLEERWEAVEAADRAFTDARLRVQSENIGLARLKDGTRLIRVGEALPGELAAWRYGSQLVQRRKQYLLVGGAALAAGIVVAGGMVALTASGGMFSVFTSLNAVWEQKRLRKVIHRIPAAESPTGKPLAVRRWHAQGGWLRPGEGGGISLGLPDVEREKPKADGWGRTKYSESSVVMLGDAQSRAVLGRAMVHLNEKGASRSALAGAVRLLEDAGSAEAYLRGAAARGHALARRKGMESRALERDASLALEMALHEEAERRAMEGELAVLEAAWREAEEIAAIADALPDGPLPEPKRG